MVSGSSPVILIVIVTVVLATIPGGAVAAEDPRFETHVSDQMLTPGTEQAVAVTLYNDAEDVDERVKTASDVEVVATAGDTPFQVRSGSSRIPTLSDGESASVSVRLRVPNDAAAGTYTLPLQLTYEFDGDERATETVHATVTVPERPRFEVVDSESSVAIGERGTATVAIRNVGSAAASDTTLALQSHSPALALEESTSTTEYIGSWAGNETKRVTVGVGVSNAATVREHAISITPSFIDDGIESTASPMSVGLSPDREQSFAIENVTVEAHSETAATIRGTIRNTGDRPVESVVATVQSRSSVVQVTQSTSSVDSLGPGESAPMAFEVRTRTGVDQAPRRFTASVSFQRADGSTYQANPISIRVSLPPATDVLSFEAVNSTLGTDESNRLAVRVTNAGHETLTDVRARLLIEPPYASAAPTAYVSELEPGDSALLHFEVTTPEDGIETTDAVAVQANATTDEGRSVASGVHLVEISIDDPERPTGNTTLLGAGAVIVLVLLGAGWWWLNH